MTRLEANIEIINKILKIAHQLPDFRFHQLLQYMGIEITEYLGYFDIQVVADEFYLESEHLLNRIK